MVSKIHTGSSLRGEVTSFSLNEDLLSILVEGSGRNLLLPLAVELIRNSSKSLLLIDPLGEYTSLRELVDIAVFVLGVNCSLNISEFFSEDFENRVHYFAYYFAEALKLDDTAARILIEALLSAEKIESITDIVKCVEEYASCLQGLDKYFAERLLKFMRLISTGLVGAALSGRCPISLCNAESSLIVLTAIPAPLRGLLYTLVTLKAVLEKTQSLMFLPRVDLTELSPRHLELLLFEKIARGELALSTAKKNTLRLLPFTTLAFERRKTKYLVFFEDKTLQVALPEVPLTGRTLPIVRKTLEPLKYRRRTLLEEIFGAESEIVFKVLSFLREGALSRDELISFIMNAFSYTSLKASRLASKLLVYKLIEDVVGRDGRYWIRISQRGLAALEEYAKLRGEAGEGVLE